MSMNNSDGKKRIVLLGSTGSIGTQTLDVVRAYSDRLSVNTLVANSNVTKIEAQIREFKPDSVVMYDEKAAGDLKVRISDLDVKVSSGMDSIIEAASAEDYDILLTAVVGMIGIRPTIAVSRIS